MRPIGIVILGMIFLFLGHGNAFSYPQGLGISEDYNTQYGEYVKSVRIKVGNNMSKKLDVLEVGTVGLNIEIASNGKLIQVSVNKEATVAPPKMISIAIMSVKQSTPFDPFPEALARNNSPLTFNISLSIKSAKP